MRRLLVDRLRLVLKPQLLREWRVREKQLLLSESVWHLDVEDSM
jgi:hypothetical protein